MKKVEMVKVSQFMSEGALEKIREVVQDHPTVSLPKRANQILSILEPEGFREVGCGTNRIVLSHKNDTAGKVVFKVALDNRGRKDNLLEMGMQPLLEWKDVAESFCISEPIGDYKLSKGLVLIQERVYVVKKDQLDLYKDKMIEKLKELSKDWLLSDVGLGSFTNWGYRGYDKSLPILLDYAYLRYKEDFIPVCEVCHSGHMVYDSNFNKTICSNVNCKNEQVASTLEIPYEKDFCGKIENEKLELEGYLRNGFIYNLSLRQQDNK